MNHDYDLVIVGGGLVGGSLALALRNSGLRIAVIESISEERRIASTAGDRALALAWGSIQILDQIGVWREAAISAAPIRHIHVSDRGHFGKLRMSAEREGLPALGYVVTARALEEGILTRLRDHLQVTTICPATVLGLKAGGDAIHLCLKRENRGLNLTARLVVAADGGNSTIRRLLEIGQSARDYRQTAIVTEVAARRGGEYTAYERFTPNGPLALLPVGSNRYSVVWTQNTDDAKEILESSDEDFTQRLQSEFGYWLGQIVLTSRRQGFPLKLIRAQRVTDERVVLIGNAVHQIHPIAGQGLNLGLRDVALFAEMMMARIALSEDIGEKSFLDGYAVARQGDLNGVIQFTDHTVRVFSNEFLPLVLCRNLGLLALDGFSPGKKLLTRYAMGLGNRIPRFS